MFICSLFFLTVTDTVTYRNIDLSSYITLYISLHYSSLNPSWQSPAARMDTRFGPA